MLLQGPKSKVRLLRMDSNFMVLQEERDIRPGKQAVLASMILIGSLALAAAQVLPIAIATLLGAALMVLTRCMTMDQAYRAVEWRAIFLIAGMLPLSTALQITGAASAVANDLLQWVGTGSPMITAMLLLIGASTLSLILSGQTAAVIMAPISIAAATAMNADPRALSMAVAVGCSLSFI